jgi:hypothetical protein
VKSWDSLKDQYFAKKKLIDLQKYNDAMFFWVLERSSSVHLVPAFEVVKTYIIIPLAFLPSLKGLVICIKFALTYSMNSIISHLSVSLLNGKSLPSSANSRGLGRSHPFLEMTIVSLRRPRIFHGG